MASLLGKVLDKRLARLLKVYCPFLAVLALAEDASGLLDDAWPLGSRCRFATKPAQRPCLVA